MENINLEKKEVEFEEINEEKVEEKKKKTLIWPWILLIIIAFLIGNKFSPVLFNDIIGKDDIYYNVEQEECLYKVKINNEYVTKSNEKYYQVNLINIDSNSDFDSIFDSNISFSHMETIVLSKKDYNKYIGNDNNAVKANVYRYNLLFSKNINKNSNIGHSGTYVVFPWNTENKFKDESTTKEFLQDLSKKFLGLEYEELDNYHYRLDVFTNLVVYGNVKKLYD